jgi:class 3 adenylate cyclase
MAVISLEKEDCKNEKCSIASLNYAAVENPLTNCTSNALECSNQDDSDEPLSISESGFSNNTVFRMSRKLESPKETVTTKSDKHIALIQKESTRLYYLRVTLLVFIFVVAIVATISVYMYGHTQETSSFLDSYNSHSLRIINSVVSKMTTTMEALDTLSTLVTLFVNDHDQRWPFVTIDKVQYYDTYIAMTGAVCISISPIVNSNERKQWEQYTIDNQGWIEEAAYSNKQFWPENVTRTDNQTTGYVEQQELFNSDIDTKRSDHSDEVHRELEDLDDSRHDQESLNETLFSHGPWTVGDNNADTDQPIVTKTDDHIEYNQVSNTTVEEYEQLGEKVQRQHFFGSNKISKIHNYTGIDETSGPYVVSWVYTPAIDRLDMLNFNLLTDSNFAEELHVLEQSKAILSRTRTFPTVSANSDGTIASPSTNTRDDIEYETIQRYIVAYSGQVQSPLQPLMYIRKPIKNDVEDHNANATVVAILSATVYWNTFFVNKVPKNVRGIHCVVTNDHGQSYTFLLTDTVPVFLGEGDQHDRNYDQHGKSIKLSDFLTNTVATENQYRGAHIDKDEYDYTITVYPSAETEAMYVTKMPILYSIAMLVLFVMTALKFILYDCYVTRRQKRVMTTAMKTDAIISSMFPAVVKDRLLDDVDFDEENNDNRYTEKRIEKFRRNNVNKPVMANACATTSSKVIADFYPAVTILFADICGFTAWCSEREPAQTFMLLETLYCSFDTSAKRLGVFKVETVGDCYVAACGLPTPNRKHAITMARFAMLCRSKLKRIFIDLTNTLGPGTEKLNMRFGLHSGAVTAGIVRGDNARFQLFGDSVNTASRMESTSIPGRIQVSIETAKLIINDGKGHWLEERSDSVHVKGKGNMNTYWLLQKKSTNSSNNDDPSSNLSENSNALTDTSSNSMNAQVSWNVQLLSCYLQHIEQQRKRSKNPNDTQKDISSSNTLNVKATKLFTESVAHQSFESCELMTNNVENPPVINRLSEESVQDLDSEIKNQLHSYITTIASLYQNDNQFHNFHHASHVTLSVSKLLARITNRTSTEDNESSGHKEDRTIANVRELLSDPLTAFACFFSAIIHDCDHTGTTGLTKILYILHRRLIVKLSPSCNIYINRCTKCAID